MPENWITKTAAAALLNTSVRTIERHIKSGKIQVQKRPRPGKSPETVCHVGDVAALQPGAFLMPVPAPGAPSKSDSTAIQLRTEEPRPDEPLLKFLNAIASKIATIATPATEAGTDMFRPWLTVDEAVTRSGLSRRFVRQLIAAHQLIAVKDGRRWKISTSSLLAWRPTQTQNQQPS